MSLTFAAPSADEAELEGNGAFTPKFDRDGLVTAIVTDAPPLGSAAGLQLADACIGNDTGMTNVAAAVQTPSYALLGERPPLEHDPVYLHNIRAKRLTDITAAHVMSHLPHLSAGVAASR